MLYLCCLPLVSTSFLLDAVIPHLMRDLYRDAARHVSTKFPCQARDDGPSTAVSGQW